MPEPSARPRSTRVPAATLDHYGARVVQHVCRPRGVGRLEQPDGSGTAGSADCGDLVRIDLQVADGLITDARFQAYGCPATIAGGSEVVSLVTGRPFLAAARIGDRQLAENLSLSPAKRRCSNMAADALHSALENALSRGAGPRPTAEKHDPAGVLVAMSGGVDSSVAALLLVQEERQVVGVTFRLWSDPACGPGRGCCSPDTVLTARRVAHQLGVPHLTVDLSAVFYEEVVEYFVAEHISGRTPNPCVRCNGRLRFAELARLADGLGLGGFATGHYATMAGDPPRLHRGTDRAKDQAYVLAGVPPGVLGRAVFPLAGLDKGEVRRLAREAHLETHDAQESQEICFIPDDDHRRFLRGRLGRRPGDIVDRGGRLRGRHEGTYNFTIGQRKGLGIAASEPLYVAAVDPAEGRVVVAGRDGLAVDTVVVAEPVRHVSVVPARGWVQLRSSGRAFEAGVDDLGAHILVRLRENAEGIAPGQAAVIFDEEGGVVLGGTISAAFRSSERPVL